MSWPKLCEYARITNYRIALRFTPESPQYRVTIQLQGSGTDRGPAMTMNFQSNDPPGKAVHQVAAAVLEHHRDLDQKRTTSCERGGMGYTPSYDNAIPTDVPKPRRGRRR